jgi:HK97 family phage major capsid protein
MKLSDGLKARRKDVLEKVQALQAAVEASESKEFTDAQAAEVDALLTENERLEKQIETAERTEKAAASASSVPATAPVGAAAGQKAEASPKEDLKADKQVALSMAAQFISKNTGEHPLKVLDDNGYTSFAEKLARQNGITKSVNTLTNSAGGILMPNPARGELLELLYPEMTFLQGNPVRVPLIGGAYRQEYATGAGTATYIGEAAKKPVIDFTFDTLSMKSKKLAAIVLITNEAQRWLFVDVAAYIERQLRIILPQAMNSAAYLGTGSGDNPTGIFNKSGIGSYAASTTGYFAAVKAPTVQELDAFTTKLAQHMTTRFIAQTGRWAWIMSNRTLNYLKNLRIGANLDRAYPELQGANPTWYGIRVLVEMTIPENTGTGTDETILGLVNFDDVLFGEEEGLRTDTSSQATIDVSGTLVHLFQQNMTALLAEMMHDFGLQRAASVVKATAVRWGAP